MPCAVRPSACGAPVVARSPRPCTRRGCTALCMYVVPVCALLTAHCSHCSLLLVTVWHASHPIARLPPLPSRRLSTRPCKSPPPPPSPCHGTSTTYAGRPRLHARHARPARSLRASARAPRRALRAPPRRDPYSSRLSAASRDASVRRIICRRAALSTNPRCSCPSAPAPGATGSA